ncbi:MAG TPA: ABC transporter permease [Bryobacteraceae bacterium]|nr:ABC transporter permease [Bryobacteraceae bacterium]
METLWRDLKYGFRTLMRTPGFTMVAVLSLALGVGANTAIFTLTNAVFLNPLPVENPARVLELFTVDHATKSAVANLTRTPLSFLNYKDFRDQSNVFTGLAAYFPTGVTLTGRGDPKPETAMLVSANYFDVLGVKAAIGRTFSAEEDRQEGGSPVAVLTWPMWQRLFGGDAGAVGKTVEFNGLAYTVVGVMPPAFKGTLTVLAPDLAFIPMSMHAQVLPGALEALFNERRMRMISVFGRLKPAVSEAQAAAAVQTIAAQLEREFPAANGGRGVEVDTLANAALGFLPRNQLVLVGVALSAVVGLVLLIACVNLANLLLARSARRAREMGIRTALGAERGTLLRQLLTESLLLSVAGGAAGLALGSAGSQLLWSFRPVLLQANTLQIQMDWRVFTFTAVVTVLTGILFGVIPAVRTSRGDLGEVLKTGSGRGGTELFTRSRLRSGLVIGQVALAMIALAGAGLFVRSMDHAEKTNPGFEARNLFTFNFDIGARRFTPENGREFLRAIVERATNVPGVHSAALTASRPLTAGGLLGTVLKEGEDDPNRGLLALINAVSPGYFDTMRIRILAGRGLTTFDRQGSARVAVVSQAMAQHFWPGENAIGKRFRLRIEQDYVQVVGVSANSVVLAIGEQPQPIAYFPVDQRYQSAMALVVRTDANPTTVMPSVMKQVQSLNSNMALVNARTVQEDIANGLWAPRMGAALFGIFGLLAMALASVGIYGVMSYNVAQRINEIGIRMAMGARPGDVLRLVVGHSMRLAGIGMVTGIVCGIAVTRLLENLLFNVRAYDPLTYVSVSALIAVVAFIAGWLPARRAAGIDPVVALRVE